MPDLYSLLQQHFLYQFSNPQLVKQAVTHRSFGADHNEKLEFLGDAILGAVIANALYQQFPDAKEGELSRLRSIVVCGESLAAIARDIGLGQHLRLGGGELASGGSERESTLADAVEALFGAIYQEAGFAAAEKSVLNVLAGRLQSISIEDSKDPKTRLQEMLQAAKQCTPAYTIVKTEGAQHEQVFTVRCEAFGKSVEGVGASKRKAEQAAAVKMLDEVVR